MSLVPIAALAAVLPVGAAGHPASGPSGVRLLQTSAPVVSLGADGRLASVWTGSCREGLLAWDPRRRSTVHIRDPKCRYETGILEQAIAGNRLAWVPWSGGLSSSTWLLTATIARPRSVIRLTRFAGRMSDGGLGNSVGNVHGDGPLLVFNTWSKCLTEPQEPDLYPCPKGVPVRTPTVWRESLWRIVGSRKRLVLGGSNELAALSVAAGRILVQRADGSLELRRANGSLLRRFPFRPGQVRGATLDASELLVLYSARPPPAGRPATAVTWRVYDPVSGALRHVLPAAPAVGRAIDPTRVAELPSANVPDVERGLAVYVVGTTVHVLRLADGRERTFRPPASSRPWPPPVLAQLEPSGLFYAYNVRGRWKGRVRFVPFDGLRPR
jgi:hypothetical protein